MSEQADEFLNSVANYKLHLLTKGIDLGYWAMKCRADGGKLIQTGVI